MNPPLKRTPFRSPQMWKINLIIIWSVIGDISRSDVSDNGVSVVPDNCFSPLHNLVHLLVLPTKLHIIIDLDRGLYCAMRLKMG